jgi:hypothetical protein
MALASLVAISGNKLFTLQELRLVLAGIIEFLP